MKWITREKVKLTGWSARGSSRKFVDLEVEFVFLPADSNPSNPHPAGEDLRWIADVFSQLELSEHEILSREFVVYRRRSER